jgi:hypothetical protein
MGTKANIDPVKRIAEIRPHEILAWCFGRVTRALVTVAGVLTPDYENGWKLSITANGADPNAGPGPDAATRLDIQGIDKCVGVCDLNGGTMDLEIWADAGNGFDGNPIGWVKVSSFTVVDRQEFEIPLGKRYGYLRPVSIGGGMGGGQPATIWVGAAL